MTFLNKKDSKRKLHLAFNKECATPGAMNLPAGHPKAERILVSRNRRTGKTEYFVCCPWLVADFFHY